MKRITIMVITIMMVLGIVNISSAKTSDYDLAVQWANENYPTATIEVVKTKSKGGYKGKEIGTKWTVRYPKKVKKGKKVTVYMVVENDDVKAMVCLGKIK